MIGKKKYMVLIVGLVSLGLLLAGGTYAWLTFNANVENGTYNADSTCFMIDYSAGGAITGTLFQSSTPKGGLSGSVTMKIKSSCSASGTGNIKLNVGTDTSSLLLSDDGALKYAVYENINSNPVSSGTISSTGDMNLYSNFALAGPSEAAKTYYIYVWLDGNIADNDYVNLSFSGNISASATQT